MTTCFRFRAEYELGVDCDKFHAELSLSNRQSPPAGQSDAALNQPNKH